MGNISLMRILQVIDAFQLGGAEEVVVNLTVALAKRGHDCCVVALNTPRNRDALGESQKSRLSEAAVKFLEMGGRHVRFNSLITPFRLALFCRAWKPDIVHSHTEIPDFVVALAGRLTDLTLARTIHISELWATHRLMGWVCESGFRDDLIVYISDGARNTYRKLRKKYALPESQTQVRIPNGIRKVAEKECFDRAQLVREFGADAKRTLFCFAGRFVYTKGFDVLLDAFERLPEEVLKKLQLHAFGHGEEREIYFKRVAERRLPILFHSPVSGISRLFPAFDAIIMPSRNEGLGLVAIESLAAGVPVIGTSAPGLREALPPEWPLKVGVEDAVALGHLITGFMNGIFDAEELSRVAMKWGKNFSIHKMVEAYETTYRDYLSLKQVPEPCLDGRFRGRHG